MNVGASLVFMNALGQQVAQARNGNGAGTTRVALAEACVVACDTTGPAEVGGLDQRPRRLRQRRRQHQCRHAHLHLGGAAVGVDYRLDPRFLAGPRGRLFERPAVGERLHGQRQRRQLQRRALCLVQPGWPLRRCAGGLRLQRQPPAAGHGDPGLATRIASGQTGANQFLGQIEAGYRIGLLEAAQATITPFARFQTVAVSQNAFNESGAQSLNLGVAQQNTTSVRTIIGADLGANIPVGMERPLGITIRLGWAHEYADTARPMTAAFAGAPTAAFTVYGAQPLRDAAVVGLGLNAQIGASTSIYARYDGEITGRDDTHSSRPASA